MNTLWERFVYGVFQYAPTTIVSISFLPCGLVFGYTIASFVAERNVNAGLIEYGPMILGACWGFIIAMVMLLIKILKSRIIYWHLELLIAAGVFHLISSCFYFAHGMDRVGAFISYVAHSTTFLAGLSFIHSICGKCTRAIQLSLAFNFYLLGIASSISLIATQYGKNVAKQRQTDSDNLKEEDLIEGIYVDFAGVYLSMAIVVLALLTGLKVLNYFGNTDCENSMDNDFRISNSSGTIFDKREDVIKRIQFFYVTKNQQWNVTLLLVFTDAIQYALFIYFVFWFSINAAVRLTDIAHMDQILWTVFGGSLLSTFCLIFISVKINYVSSQLCLIILTLVSMIIGSTVHTAVPFWLILFFFGMCFSNLQIALVEVVHFRFMEVFIYTSYALKFLSTSIVYYYFVSNSKNSYFNSTDESTLMAQGFVFAIITSLLALVVGMKVPRTYRTSLFDIQYGLLGIIFKKHQIEQLNVRWLNDGTIPTISRPDN